MNLSLPKIALVVPLALAAAVVSHAAAAEIRLRPECRPQGPVILLSEAAEIFAADDEEVTNLGNIELMPTPAPGSKSFLRLREIQDQLELHGVNLAEHRFSGASQISIVAGETAAKPSRRMTTTSAKLVQRTIHDAILKFLTEKASSTEPWEVDVQLDDEQTRLAAAGRDFDVTSSGPPWTGKHPFSLSGDSPAGPIHLTVEAQVTLPPALVVATRTLSKGAMIRPGDVQLQRGRPGAAASDGIQTLEDVLGLEATRSIAEGQILDAASVRQPVLVHKGDVVTVYSRRPGIQVRVTARSRDDGSMGEVVNVESLSDRSTFLARVRNSAEVEVLAMPVTVDGNQYGPPAAAPHTARQTSFTKK